MAGNLSLENVQEEATKLLQVILSCPVGARKAVYSCRDGHSYSRLLTLQRYEMVSYVFKLALCTRF